MTENTNGPRNGLPFWLVTDRGLPEWLERQTAAVRAWLASQQFKAEKHRVVAWADARGQMLGAVCGLGSVASPDAIGIWQAAALADRLPPGQWRCATELDSAAAERLQLGFGLGRYRYDALRSSKGTTGPELLTAEGPRAADITATVRALARARDLINTPANLLGPEEFAVAVAAVGAAHGAQVRVLSGAELQRGYPLIAAVGQGSARAPRLIDLRWGANSAPRVTLVGKGVCFDSGGLDLKPSASMLLMKKDMGGAACALATAEILMQSCAPVQLRLLIPAVENSVGNNAYRPGDVLRSRKGLTVEIGNTDAEGRLVLADALADADAENPDLLVDFATLTGAARTALGPELPAAFSNDATLLSELTKCAARVDDPLWAMPLWQAYDDDLNSKVADVNNVASHGFAGAIIGALFLKRFIAQCPRWIHLDLYAWNARERPGRPVGAEAQCVRALVDLIRERHR